MIDKILKLSENIEDIKYLKNTNYEELVKKAIFLIINFHATNTNSIIDFFGKWTFRAIFIFAWNQKCIHQLNYDENINYSKIILTYIQESIANGSRFDENFFS